MGLGVGWEAGKRVGMTAWVPGGTRGLPADRCGPWRTWAPTLALPLPGCGTSASHSVSLSLSFHLGEVGMTVVPLSRVVRIRSVASMQSRQKVPDARKALAFGS